MNIVRRLRERHHGAAVEAEFWDRVHARNPGRALPVRLRADGGPLHDGVHPDANGAAERNKWLFIVVLAIAALIGVVLAIKGGGA